MSFALPIVHKNSASFESYMAYVNSLPLLTEQQERELFVKYQKYNDLNAVQQIVISHLRFVAHIARSYHGYGLQMEDLVQEGAIGLMKSVKKFSLDFGVRLSSFAVHYIKAEIQEYIVRNWRLVKATTTKAKRKLFYNLRRLKATSDWLSSEEKAQIASQLAVTEKDVTEMEVQLCQSDVMLDSSFQQEGESNVNYRETLLTDNHQQVEELLIKRDFSSKMMAGIREFIATLDERSKDIIFHRWLSDEKKTHKYFSEKYQVSQERIRQIEERALAKIRQHLRVVDT